MTERVQKLIAAGGACSRRTAEEWIRAGRVTVNGRRVSLGDRADPDTDVIAVDGRAVGAHARKVYLMLHKPRGFVTTLSDERGRRTVAELVRGCGTRVFPVGRLDKDTEGLLLLTDDGALAHRLLSPRHHVDKVYLAEIDGEVDASDVAAFEAGMTLGDGTQCLPAGLESLGKGRCRVTLREGKFHQVKRMLAQRGKPVLHLKRLSMGDLQLDSDLKVGEFRLLTAQEVQNLKK